MKTYHDHDGIDVGHVDAVLDDRGGQQDVPPAERELEHDVFEVFHLSFRRLGGRRVGETNKKHVPGTCVKTCTSYEVYAESNDTFMNDRKRGHRAPSRERALRLNEH